MNGSNYGPIIAYLERAIRPPAQYELLPPHKEEEEEETRSWEPSITTILQLITHSLSDILPNLLLHHLMVFCGI